MALQTIQGVSLMYPELFNGLVTAPSVGTTALIDATGEKIAFCGQVFFPARTGTKTIDKVWFRFGTVTKAGGSGLTVSLQNVSSTFPLQPDETQDQYRAIANGDASFASNTNYTTGLITSDGTDTGSKRSVVYGEFIAVVVEFDGSGRLGSDSVILSGLGISSNVQHATVTTLKTGGTWASIGIAPNVIFEFSDGRYGGLTWGYPCTATTNHDFKQDTAGADEYALQFSLPFPCKVDGAWAYLTTTNASGDLDIVLYDGTTAMTNGTLSFPGEYSGVNANRATPITFAAEVQLAANHTYYLAFKPTQTTQNIRLVSFDVATANHLTLWPGGAEFQFTTRVDSGSWASPTTTRRLMAGIRISAFDDGAGGGAAGMLYTPGMEGLG